MRTIMLATTLALMTPIAAATDLADLRWRHRVVVVTDAEVAARQRTEQARDPSGWAERQLVLVELTGERATVDGEPAGLDVARTLDRLELNGATVALVGLDGGVKERRTAAFTNDELYAAVDAMPMRRGERANSGSGGRCLDA